MQSVRKGTEVAEITKVAGPMFAGKSTNLIGAVKKWERKGKKYGVATHELDNHKSPTSQLQSRESSNAATAFRTDSLSKIPDDVLKSCDYYAVDEAHFFDPDDLRQFIMKCLKFNVNLYVYCLNGDFEQKEFPAISAINPLIHGTISLYAVCCREGCDKDAIHTVRLNDSKQAIEVDNGQYRAICSTCLLDFRNDKSSIAWKKEPEKEKNNVHASPESPID